MTLPLAGRHVAVLMGGLSAERDVSLHVQRLGRATGGRSIHGDRHRREVGHVKGCRGD